MSTSCAGTWPEQNAVDEWLKKHDIGVHFKIAMELKNAVTKYRLEVQKERDQLRTANAELSTQVGALREAMENLPKELKKKVCDPNYYDYEELTFPPNWANEEQRQELEDWLDRLLEHAGQLAEGVADDAIPETPVPARWAAMEQLLKDVLYSIENNRADSGAIYMGDDTISDIRELFTGPGGV